MSFACYRFVFSLNLSVYYTYVNVKFNFLCVIVKCQFYMYVLECPGPDKRDSWRMRKKIKEILRKKEKPGEEEEIERNKEILYIILLFEVISKLLEATVSISNSNFVLSAPLC